MRAKSVNLEAPLLGSVALELSRGISQSSRNQQLIANGRIDLQGYLELEVSGHADIRGMFIKAERLKASFESLWLESVQSVIEARSSEYRASLSGNALQ